MQGKGGTRDAKLLLASKLPAVSREKVRAGLWHQVMPAPASNDSSAQQGSLMAPAAAQARLDQQGVVVARDVVARSHGAVQPNARAARRAVRLIRQPIVYLSRALADLPVLSARLH